MLDTTSSVFVRPHQCPNCGWPVDERPSHGEIVQLPALIRLNTIRRIAEQVAYRSRRPNAVTADEIMDKSLRIWRVSHARHEVMWIARSLKNGDGTHRFSFPMIGRTFGMDHTSVVHGFRQHAKKVRAAVIAKVAADNAASARLHGAA